MPDVFNRKAGTVNDLKLWKATEFRTFLLYTGPVLKYVLDQKYRHFLGSRFTVHYSIARRTDLNIP